MRNATLAESSIINHAYIHTHTHVHISIVYNKLYLYVNDLKIHANIRIFNMLPFISSFPLFAYNITNTYTYILKAVKFSLHKQHFV